LTRYRVMVVAASGDDHFGSGESDLTARLPLSARPSAPRFANYGDIFQLPIVVQNQQDTELVVDVVLQTANLTPTEPMGQQVTVPANGRVEVRFPVATDQAGTAGLRVAVVSGDLADAAVTILPVYTPATAEAFATYGTIDSGSILQPIVTPEGVIEQFGGLEITTSSTAVQALTDAVIYLNEYPYDSSDGRASRILAISALRPVLEEFDAEGLPAANEIDAQVQEDVDALAAMQNDDGGWPWWRKYDRSEPFNSVQVVHALLQAKEAGYNVPQSTLDWGLAFIADIESHIPSDYGQTQRDTIRAYALWTRALAGQRDNAKAEALFDERGDELQVDALAWLWGSTEGGTHTEIGRLIGNRAVETAGAANFTTSYDDAAYVILHSDRRTDGIVLDALIDEDPDSDLIPKVVSGLLGHRVKGRWDNAQENAFILLALGKYFEVYEGQTPDFVARVWLGDRYAGDHTFEGRETDTARMDLPMTDVMEVGDSGIVIAKDGAGRLYYRIGLRYAPADLDLDALDRGFVVARTYEAVDDPGDLRLDENGVWHIKAGARVRVRLTMVAESQRTHVALIDPLPAGFEALNPDLQVTQSVIPEEGEDGGPIPVDSDMACCSWWGPWYQYQQLRDDRTEAFTTWLGAGTYNYSYVARATTPGEFVVPPARAEQMYEPETFGRTATDRVVIE
ncbi:MAG TPA: alpha-2-macroglobulin family protein, partial [Ilumatobacteraceae bacterium]|nr:alpha-2-macroglobulin family protein [Ilumatobacteraceae bacterium]